MIRRIGCIAVVCVLAGCSPIRHQSEPFAKVAEDYLHNAIAFSPASATQIGYHVHNGKRLDAELDDYSPGSIRAQADWYRNMRLRLAQNVDVASLDPQDRADYQILNDQISLALLELDRIQNYKHNPTSYVELAGNALYSPFVLEYADKGQRFQHIIARLKQIPRLMSQAKANLVSAPTVWTAAAKDENDGNIALIDQEMRNGCPPELRSEYDAAAGPAIESLKGFNQFLTGSLALHDYAWQLGADKYAQKFRLVLETDQTPDQVLARAEDELKRTRQEMLRLAAPIYEKLTNSKLEPLEHVTPQRLNAVVGAVLANIAKQHATPDTYFSDARRDLAEATAYVKQADLLTLPPRSNLQVIETPMFMRGIYSVGGFSAAPALEPQLGAFYWITPITKDLPAERAESKLREYNYYGLKILTIHEAMPGHYVQLEYANDVEPRLRRLLRSVFGNGPYVEGWAVYATEAMLDAGYLSNSPELRLTFLKHQLRVLTNAIMDVRLQTNRMSDDEALDLMLTDGFQEREEAVGKIRRAKLSSAQLPMYYVGFSDWKRLLNRYKEVKGDAFSIKNFHEDALKQGAVPLPVLSGLLTGKPL